MKYFQILKVIKNHFVSSLVTSINLSKFSEVSVKSIFTIRFFYSIPFFRNRIKINKKINISNHNITEYKEKLDFSNLINNLQEKGYYVSELKDSILENINNSFSNNNFSYKMKDPKKKKEIQIPKNLNLDEIISFSIKNNIPHLMLSIDQSFSSPILNLAKSELLLSLAKSYLSSDKVILRSHCYISNPISVDESTQKNNAQFYHYDCDYKKFLKVFIYLTDVNENSGPHLFIPYTHKKKKMIHIPAERLSDEIIKKHYPGLNACKFLGKKGKIIFEDTFGFHKGELPKKLSRAVLILEYGIPPRIQYDGNEIIV
jgi:hypothetical protein